jgi:hypothetical protein
MRPMLKAYLVCPDHRLATESAHLPNFVVTLELNRAAVNPDCAGEG